MNGGLLTLGGSRRSRSDRSRVHNRPVKHKRRNGGSGSGGGGVAATAMELMPLGVHVDGINHMSHIEGAGLNPANVQSGGHRCSMRHTRTKRTRKAHAGRRSRKHKSRGKKFRMSLKGIFGKS